MITYFIKPKAWNVNLFDSTQMTFDNPNVGDEISSRSLSLMGVFLYDFKPPPIHLKYKQKKKIKL